MAWDEQREMRRRAAERGRGRPGDGEPDAPTAELAAGAGARRPRVHDRCRKVARRALLPAAPALSVLGVVLGTIALATDDGGRGDGDRAGERMAAYGHYGGRGR